MQLIDDLIDQLHSTKHYHHLDKIPIQVYTGKRHSKSGFKKIKILLLCNPCNGFGDVVFAMKLRNYLADWYNCDIKIASTKVDNFKTLGEKDENLYFLKGGKSDQCRRFRHLEFHNSKGKPISVPKADLIFVAPLQMDYDSNYSDIKTLVPYSNNLNTYFFSEYNDDLRKEFDFHTGVGDDRYGMLFTDTGKTSRIKSLKNPYVVVYIARDVARSETCFLQFIEMICKKYSQKVKKFDIVVPPWIGNDIENNIEGIGDKVFKIISKYFDQGMVKMKEKEFEIFEPIDKRNIVTFRGDILPLPYDSMKNLFHYSLKDILVTGDQSITDVLSCCWKNKLPMYQIVPWKKDFSKELAKHLPQKFLKYIRTSCGNAKAINYNPSFSKFMKKWDFRRLAKPKLDAIMAFTRDCKKDETVKEIRDIFLKSRTKDSIINKLEEL